MRPFRKALKRLNVFRRKKRRFQDRVLLTHSEETVCSDLSDDFSVSSKSYSCDPFEDKPIIEDEANYSESEHEEKAPNSDSLIETTGFPEFTAPLTTYQNPHILISILLLHPEEKTFELIKIKCCSATATVREVLCKIPDSTTEPSLAFQTYSGLCYADDGANITDKCLKAVGEDTVLFAVPDKYSSDRITVLGKQILASPSMMKAMHRLKQRLSLRQSSIPKRSTAAKQNPMATVDNFSSKPQVTASAYDMPLTNDDLDVLPPKQYLSASPEEELVTAHVLLLDPTNLIYELIHVDYSFGSSSILDVLCRVPYISTRPELGCLRYIGLCNPVDRVEVTDESLEASRHRTVLVAIPKGYTADKMATHGAQILLDSRLTKELSKLGLEMPPKSMEALRSKPYRRSDSVSTGSSKWTGTVSIPSVIAARSFDSSCQSSCSMSSHQSVISCDSSLTCHNFYKNVFTASTGRALKNHKSKRARRSQRQAFAIRAALLAVSVMAAIYTLDPTARSGVAHQAMGFSGFLQAIVFLLGMVVVQRTVQRQESRQTRMASPPPKPSAVPDIVLIDTDNDGSSLVVH